MEKEVKIIPPEGYEIDRKNSTLECIKFKEKKKELYPYFERIKSHNGKIEVLCNAIYAGFMSSGTFDRIPGNTKEDKAESICKLIYEAWEVY
jgi:hypothetical protein